MMPWPMAGRSLRRGAPPHFIRAGKQGAPGFAESLAVAQVQAALVESWQSRSWQDVRALG